MARDPGAPFGPRADRPLIHERPPGPELTPAELTTLARQAALAEGLARLPGVSRALAKDRIDLPQAAVFADQLAPVEYVAANAIAAITLPDAPGMTTGQLRAALRRQVLAHDPETPRAAGSMDQFRAEAFTARLTGHPPQTLLCPSPGTGAGASPSLGPGASASPPPSPGPSD
jgi:hypothetical protein